MNDDFGTIKKEYLVRDQQINPSIDGGIGPNYWNKKSRAVFEEIGEKIENFQILFYYIEKQLVKANCGLAKV